MTNSPWPASQVRPRASLRRWRTVDAAGDSPPVGVEEKYNRGIPVSVDRPIVTSPKKMSEAI
jgi:hypothetical protein